MFFINPTKHFLMSAFRQMCHRRGSQAPHPALGAILSPSNSLEASACRKLLTFIARYDNILLLLGQKRLEMTLGVVTPASLSLDGQLWAVFDSLSQASQQDAAPFISPLINPFPTGLSSLGSPKSKLFPPKCFSCGVQQAMGTENQNTKENKKKI